MEPPEPRRYDVESLAARAVANEDTDFFRGLPPEAQAEFRRRWWAEVGRHQDRLQSRVDRRKRSVVEGVVLFLVVSLVWDAMTVPSLVLSAVLGAVCGLLFDRVDAGRFLCLLIAMPAYLLLRACSPTQTPYQMFFGFVAMAALSAALGTVREIGYDAGRRRSV